MVELRENPVGIDKVIDRIQKRIHDSLYSKWGNLTIYGRVYKKTDREGKISLEVYNSRGEYHKVLYSEGNKIFFIQGNNPTLNFGDAKNELWAVCIIKLDNLNEREDEKVHIDLNNELIKVVGLNNVLGLEYGLPNLKRVAEDPFEFGNFKFSDIHPYHVFMVKMTVDYELTINEC